MLIPRLWFDREKCKQGLECLRQYHRAAMIVPSFRANPVHDWSSHAADAFRYFAVGLRETGPTMKAPQMQAMSDYDPFAA